MSNMSNVIERFYDLFKNPKDIRIISQHRLIDYEGEHISDQIGFEHITDKNIGSGFVEFYGLDHFDREVIEQAILCNN